MPTYEYECEECHHTFTQTERIAEHERRERDPSCPECGSENVSRLLSTFFAKTRKKS